VLGAGLMTFTNPKAVHAVAAALVEVTNTAANPVVNADATRSAAQIVEIFCVINDGSCNGVEPGGATNLRNYMVPSGQSLVITDIEILPLSAPNLSEFGIAALASGPTGRQVSPTYRVASDALTHHFALQRGIVWPSGGALIPGATAGLQATLRGYLTAN